VRGKQPAAFDLSNRLMAMQVFLDTDIGDDIDDALALGMLLTSPEVELLGVTTVHGEVEIRSRIAAKVLAAYGRGDVPVMSGYGQPYNKVPRTGWAEFQGRIAPPSEPFDNILTGSVVEFMHDTLAAAPEPVALVAIGPLTNVARLLERFPEVKRHLACICLMGGGLDPQPEYNIQMDPEAAQIVMHAGVPLMIIPFNITSTCEMEPDLIDTLMASTSPEQQVLAELVRLWRQVDGRQRPVLHDPLAIGALLRPELYQFTPMHIEVELLDPELRGLTRCAVAPQSSSRLCSGVDYTLFHELVRERLSGSLTPTGHAIKSGKEPVQ
jgi:inosine-uridine nucleoside N-ribohydrolase